MKDKTLVIMAAGMGSRFGGLKQMTKVGPSGEVLLDYSVYSALKAGFNKVVFVVKEENYGDFREIVGEKIEKNIKVEYVFQKIKNIPSGFSVPENRKKPWGTAHAVMSCKDAVREPFAVINADDYYGSEAFEKMANWVEQTDFDGEKYEFCMVSYILSNTLTENGSVSRGVCKEQDGVLSEVKEYTDIKKENGKIICKNGEDDYREIDGNTPVSLNCWCFDRRFLDELEGMFSDFLEKNLEKNPEKCEFYLPSAVQSLIDAKKCRVKVLSTSDRWYGMTYKEDEAQVKEAILNEVNSGKYPEKLWK